MQTVLLQKIYLSFKLFNIVNILSLVPAEVTDLDCCKSEVFQHSGKTIIYVVNHTLMDIISENTEVFTGFKKISTPFFCAFSLNKQMIVNIIISYI